MGIERKEWLGAWLGGAAIGVANGALREGTYGRALPEPTANAISVATGIAAFGALFRALQRRWPLRSGAEAIRVGLAWFGLTVCFELGFGRLVAKRGWRELGAEYDLRRGRLWPLVLVAIAGGPAAARAVGARG